jgi:lysine 2,3-aminomutase
VDTDMSVDGNPPMKTGNDTGAAIVRLADGRGRTLRHVDALIEAGLVARKNRERLDAVARRYPIAVTRDMADLIDPSDPADPIARQFVPGVEELNVMSGERADPIGDETFSPVEGVVHRYPDRALLKLVNVCAVYCRFCFRRETVGPGRAAMLSDEAFARAVAYLRERGEIWEVILTGGDPLVMPPRRLREVMAELGRIAHIKVIRIHTRVPVADPSRVTAELARALGESGKTVWIALHANHPRELTPAARAACARLLDAGLPMVSQSVLLRGVNDSVSTIETLMRAFVECRIKPYYLHHGDLAPGTAHLRTTIAEGRVLMRALRGRVSGLCQPDYVLDIPGGHGKVSAGLAYVEQEGARWRVADYCGDVHAYADSGGGDA